MGKEGHHEYTEYVLVKTFGVGIYDLPSSTVESFLDIMEIEAKVAKKQQKKPTPNTAHGRLPT